MEYNIYICRPYISIFLYSYILGLYYARDTP